MTTNTLTAGNTNVKASLLGGDDGTLNIIVGPAGSPVTALSIDAAGNVTTPLTGGFMHVRDEKASNTSGGASAASTQTRTLNTVVTNTITGASLSSNQVTLPAGTYRIFAHAPAFRTNRHRARLTNVTDTSIAILGSSEFSGSGGDYTASRSWIIGRIVITATKAFTITHATEAVTANGLGVETNDGQLEIYTTMTVWKE